MGLCAPWAAYADLCGPNAGTVDEALFTRWVMPASEYLYVKSGRQFKGLCSRTVRPCSIRRRPSLFPREWGWRASWFTFPATTTFGFPWGWCGCTGDGDPLEGSCGCGPIPSISLGAAKIHSVEQVKIDGAVLDPTAYRVDEGRLLARIDGDYWPSRQDMRLPDTALNTFSVQFTAGRPLPALAVIAAATLAGEWALACAGSSACRLPRKAQSVARQGISIQLRDVFAAKSTGLVEVDSFIDAYNPKGRERRAIVVNPDTLPPIRRTS